MPILTRVRAAHSHRKVPPCANHRLRPNVGRFFIDQALRRLLHAKILHLVPGSDPVSPPSGQLVLDRWQTRIRFYAHRFTLPRGNLLCCSLPLVRRNPFDLAGGVEDAQIQRPGERRLADLGLLARVDQKAHAAFLPET